VQKGAGATAQTLSGDCFVVVGGETDHRRRIAELAHQRHQRGEIDFDLVAVGDHDIDTALDGGTTGGEIGCDRPGQGESGVGEFMGNNFGLLRKIPDDQYTERNPQSALLPRIASISHQVALGKGRAITTDLVRS